MSATPVERLNAALEGRYRIESELGEGGMATVYLADDLKHERKVALKVLKPELAAVVGAERFLAEIKTTANLQHPHILPLFDSGEADTYLFYVMPRVEGESLRDRLDREHQLPVDEAVQIAKNVAEALDYAHRQGVIHRDIKPANILLQDGKPVVSDFGIALAVGSAGAARLTETGLSVGTPYYMSPEQATGDQHVGPPSDTYALAALLYEMLTGDPPYVGSTAQAVLGKIIQGAPVSATEIRKSVPANVDAAIRRALEKLPADRFTAAQGFARALGDEHFRYGGSATARADVAAGPWKQLTLAATTVAALFAIGFGWALLRSAPPAPLSRFSSPFEDGQAPMGRVRLTPDGSELVYVGPGAAGQGTQLWIRRWADLDATPIRGTEDANNFTLSPDGREVAFTVNPGPLRVVPLDGGPGRTLVDEVILVDEWTSDGMVYFTGSSSAISRIPASGGGSEVVAILTETLEGETMHYDLTVLPGGKMGVFEVLRSVNGSDAEVWAIDLDTRERRFVTAGHSPSYVSTGHLLFATPSGVLMAAPIDPGAAELTGPAVPVAEGLAIVPPIGLARYAVSETGTLIYQSGGAGAVSVDGLLEAVWVTRSGDATPVDAGWRFMAYPDHIGLSLSSDGERVAVSRFVDANLDIWIKQLPDGPFERFTSDDSPETYPLWSTDGLFVTYIRGQPAPDYDVWRRRADGTGAPELLLDHERGLFQPRVSPDGEWMVFRAGGLIEASGERDIVGFRPGVDSVAIPLIATPEFSEQDPALSPDGRWLAYTSDRSGRNEVYVSPFPDVDASRVPVSTNGGFGPLWAHSGAELFFVDADRNLVAAEVEAVSGFRVLERETLFAMGSEYFFPEGSDGYAIAPDDQRFLMVRVPSGIGLPGGESRFILIENWFEELTERVGN